MDDILYAPIDPDTEARAELSRLAGFANDTLTAYSLTEAERLRSRLMRDREWAAAYMAGDKDKLRQMVMLSAIIAVGTTPDHTAANESWDRLTRK